MNRKIKYCFLLILLSQLLSANKIIIKPAIFSVYSTTGRDWMYQKKPINIFGFGLKHSGLISKIFFMLNFQLASIEIRL